MEWISFTIGNPKKEGLIKNRNRTTKGGECGKKRVKGRRIWAVTREFSPPVQIKRNAVTYLGGVATISQR